MTAKTSGDSSPGVSRNIFRPGIQDSFTTQGLSPNGPRSLDTEFRAGVLAPAPARLKPQPALAR